VLIQYTGIQESGIDVYTTTGVIHLDYFGEFVEVEDDVANQISKGQPGDFAVA